MNATEEKARRFVDRMIQARREKRCQGVMASDFNRDCPNRPVARVHLKLSEPPAFKCQYHLDVCVEYVGAAIERVEIL